MNHTTLRLLIVTILAVLTGAAACGPATNLPTPMAAPTAGERPTATAQPSPTPITLGTLKTFTHASNQFRIDYPPEWTTFPQDNGVIVLAPGHQIGYTVVFNAADRAYTTDELSQYMAGFVQQNFAGPNSNFKALRYQEQKDGSIVGRFSTTDPKQGPTISQVTVRQQGQTIYLVYLSAPQPQWDAVHTALETLAGSFTPLAAAKAAPGATPTPPVWALIGPTGKEFGFLYASNWQVITQTESEISLSSPEDDMHFWAGSQPWPGVVSNPNAATEAALAQIKKLQTEHPNLQHLPPAAFPLDTATGATIDFIYTTGATHTVAGSVIAVAGNGKMHQIVFTAPTELYNVALKFFNPMLKSFKFLTPETELPENNAQ